MSWDKAKISDICSDIFDGPHATPPVSKDGAIFLGISNITPDGHLDLSNPKYINEADLPKWTKRVTPLEGDIVFSYEATLNLYAIIPPGFHGCLGRRMALIRPNENKVLGKFLFYYFFSDEWRKTIAENTVIGATVDRIPLIRFPNFPVSYPSIEKQFKIVEVLSSYDDLIKNNRKQIKLLEEAAQRLYKEWFVDLRFPGHETTPIVNGIPKGWHEGTIQDVVIYHDKKRKPLSGMQRAEMQGEYRYYGAASILDYVNDYLFDGTYLLLGEDGTVVTEDGFPVLQYVTGKFWVNNHAHVLTGQLGYPTEYLYMMFKSTKVKDVVTGAAQPKISQARLSNKKIIVPSKQLVSAYCDITGPMFKEIINLEHQITVLKEARDRLLPKLMSGEIEV